MKKRNDSIRGYASLLLALSVFTLLASLVLAGSEPQGPTTITSAGSGRFQNNSGSFIIQAKAGNVTALVIDNKRVTEAWQGYYGNVTGTITLDDAGNFTLYDWSLPNPSGEIYASNGSVVSWSNIYCMNVSGTRSNTGDNGAGGSQGIIYNINGSQIELNFGINVTDKDGLNETFNDTYTDATGFRTGAITINAVDGCSLAHPYTTEAYNSAGWQELLLSDNTSLVFTALIRENANGFQPGSTDTYDFQTLVLENGHVGSEVAVTNYYFFVELS